jgi:hypothetical protein
MFSLQTYIHVLHVSTVARMFSFATFRAAHLEAMTCSTQWRRSLWKENLSSITTTLATDDAWRIMLQCYRAHTSEMPFSRTILHLQRGHFVYAGSC